MSKVKYEFNKWISSEAEVMKDFAAKYAVMEHKESLVDRKETRRHQSLDKSLEHGWDIPDRRVNVEEEAERNEITQRLYKAIAQLKPQQQELIRRVYFNNEKMSDIAREEEVDASNIRHRMQRTLKILKKFLQQTATFTDSYGYKGQNPILKLEV